MSRDAVIAEAERLVAPAGPGCFGMAELEAFLRSEITVELVRAGSATGADARATRRSLYA